MDLYDLMYDDSGPQQAAPGSDVGDVSRGFQTGFKQAGPLAKGAVGMLGDWSERIFGVGEDLRDWGYRGFVEGMQKLEPLQRETDDVTVAWNRAKEGDWGALIDWAQYAFGYGVAQIGESAVAALAGGMLGGAMGSSAGPAGTVGGAAAGAAGAAAAKGAFKNFIAHQLAGTVSKRGAQIAATEAGKKLSKDEIQREAVKSVATSIGRTGGLLAFAGMQEGGSIYGEAREHKDGEQLTGAELARATGATFLATILEAGSDVFQLGLLTGKFPNIASTRPRRAATGGILGGAVEGATEVGQTAIERVGAGKPVADAEGINELINAGAMGTFIGGGAGTVGGALSSRPPEQQPSTPTLPPTPSVRDVVETIGQAETVEEAIRYAGILSQQTGDALRQELEGTIAEFEARSEAASEALRAQAFEAAEALNLPNAPKAAELIDAVNAQRDAAAQAMRDADFPRAADQVADQKVEQAEAITRVSGFDDPSPTAMGLAFEAATNQLAGRMARNPRGLTTAQLALLAERHADQATRDQAGQLLQARRNAGEVTPAEEMAEALAPTPADVLETDPETGQIDLGGLDAVSEGLDPSGPKFSPQRGAIATQLAESNTPLTPAQVNYIAENHPDEDIRREHAARRVTPPAAEVQLARQLAGAELSRLSPRSLEFVASAHPDAAVRQRAADWAVLRETTGRQPVGAPSAVLRELEARVPASVQTSFGGVRLDRLTGGQPRPAPAPTLVDLERKPIERASRAAGVELVEVDPATLPAQRTAANNGVRGATRLSKSNWVLLQRIAQVFKKKIVLYESSEAGDGFVVTGDNQHIYLNADASSAHHLVIVGHELAHLMRRESPELFNALASWLVSDETNLIAFHRYYHDKDLTDDQIRAELADPAKRDMLVEEFVADLIGNRFGEMKTWTMLADHAERSGSTDLLRRVADFVIAFIRNLLERNEFTRFKTDTLVTDLRTAEQRIRRFLRDHLDRVEQGLVETNEGRDAFSRTRRFEVGGYGITEARDGSITVTGDVDEIRSLVTARGAVRGGKLTFTAAQAAQTIAELSGETNVAGRAGAVTRHPRKADGTYIGAAEQFNTPAKIPRLRRLFRSLAKEGERGKLWYEQSGRAVLDMVQGDVEEAKKFVGLLAIYSPKNAVPGNTTMALRAWAMHKAGQPIQGVSLSKNDEKATEFLAGRFTLGEKTSNFHRNLLREIDEIAGRADNQGVTVDMWMMRAAGYDTDAPTKAAYRFVEVETNRLAQELGWEPQQAQAAIWVAMKARTEDKGVKKRTEQKSIAAGYMHYDEKGLRVVTNKAAHRRLWLDEALALKVEDEALNSAKFDFADGLRRHLMQVSMEAQPSTSTPLLPGIHTAPQEQRAEFLHAIRQAMSDGQGRDALAARLGLMFDGDVIGPGYWQGDSSPSLQAQFATAPQKAVSQTSTPSIDPAQRELLDYYSDMVGLLLRQDAVAYHRAFPAKTKRDANGVRIDLGRVPTRDEILRFGEELKRVLGDEDDGWYGIISAKVGLHVIQFPDFETGQLKMPNPDWHAAVIEASTSTFSQDTTSDVFYADGGYRSNDWTENPDGQEYRQRLGAAGRSDVYGWARDQLAPQIQAVYEDFSERYGWGDPGRIQLSTTRSAEPAVRPGSGGRGSGGAFHARDRQPDSDTVTGIHYGREQVPALSGSFYGRGIRGAEARRLSEPEVDPRIRRRVYFYVAEGEDLPRPEVGLGVHTYRQTFDNIAPAQRVGELWVQAGRNANAFESAIIDAGYDGYQSQGMMVLLDVESIPVEYLGNRTQLSTTRRDFLRAGAAIAAAPRPAFAGVTVGRAQPLSAEVVNRKVSEAAEKILRGNRTGGAQLEGAKALREAFTQMVKDGPAELRPLIGQILPLLPREHLLLEVNDVHRVNAHGAVSWGALPKLTLYTAEGRGGLTYDTILHESLHAAVLARYITISQGAVRSNDALIGTLPPGAAEAIGQLADLWREFGQFVRQSDLDSLSPRTRTSVREAQRSPDEFFVRMLTDPHLQAWAADKAYEGKTLLERFKDWVKTSLLGFRKEGTAPSWLDAGLTAAQDLVEVMGRNEANYSRLEAIRQYQRASREATRQSRTRTDLFQSDLIGPRAKGNRNSLGMPIAHHRQALANFQRWFGDSQIVDEDGHPLVLFHSTSDDFDEFEIGRPTANSIGFARIEVNRAAIFASPDARFSQNYLRGREGDNVMPIYMRMSDPLDLRDGLTEEDYERLGPSGLRRRVLNTEPTWLLFDDQDLVDELKALGYDGAIFYEDDWVGGAAQTYAVFGTDQIKSAIGNSGTFDGTNTITKSPARREIENLIQTRGVDQMLDEYDALPQTFGGKVINVDESRELSPMYRQNRAKYAGDIHEPLSALMKEKLRRAIAKPPVHHNAVMLAGGGGSGKGSVYRVPILGAMVEQTDFVYDAVMSNFDKARKIIDDTLASGRKVMLIFVARDPMDAWVNGVLPRARETGRTVPIDAFLEAHRGAARTFERVVQNYKDDTRVRTAVVDNTRGFTGQRLGTIETVNRLRAPFNLKEQIRDATEEIHRNSRIDPDILEGLGFETYGGFRLTWKATAELGLEAARLVPQGDPGSGQQELVIAQRSQTRSQAFRDWFGGSRITNEDGTPRVMYHGTAGDFDTFRAKQAGAIFVTDDIQFAEHFAEISHDYMITHWREFIRTPVDLRSAKNAVRDALREDGYTGGQIKKIIGDPLQLIQTDAFRQWVADLLPSGPNILPLFVRAERPFDPATDTLPGLDPGLVDLVRSGSWSAIETEHVQSLIRKHGYDSFWVRESGRRNLAVYDPNQLKSAIGNEGSFSREEDAITASPTRSPEFQRWFGDSKVVDENGEPLVVYHGTYGDFTAFDSAFMYSGEGASHTGSGFYFTTNPESASRYAIMKGDEGGQVMPVYLSLQKPLYIDFATGETTGADITLTPAQVRKIILSAPDIRSTEDSPLLNFGDIAYDGFDKVLREAVRLYAGSNNIAALRNDFFNNDHAAWLKAFSKATGYDSAYTTTANGDVHYVAWFPEQIKSAIGNSGVFDPTNPDITASPARGLYSALASEVGKLKMNSAPASGWQAAIKGLINKGLVKRDEVVWSGLEEWIDLQPGKITREQVSGYLAANGVQIQETVLSDRVRELGTKPKFRSWSSFPQNGYREILLRLPEPPAPPPPAARYATGDDLRAKSALLLDGGFTAEAIETAAREIDEHGTVENAVGYLNRLIARGYGYTQAHRDALGLLQGIVSARRSEILELKNDLARKTFSSSHWGEKNVLAHVRLSETPDGHLFVEEIQSDWAQEGRRRGFQSNSTKAQDALRAYEADLQQRFTDRELRSHLDAGMDEETARSIITHAIRDGSLAHIAQSFSEEELERYLQLRSDVAEERKSNREGAPRAPFVDSTDKWVTLALKRIIAEALEAGHHRVVFIDGETSANRYNLRQVADQIYYTPSLNGGELIAAKEDESILELSDIAPEDLANYIGEARAKRLLEAPNYRDGDTVGLTGEALEIGGEGMNQFYDKVVPSALKRIADRLGGRIGRTALEIFPREDFSDDLVTKDFVTLVITDQMRSRAQDGLPQFSRTRHWGEVDADTAASLEHVFGPEPVALTPKQRLRELGQWIRKNVVRGIFDQFEPIKQLDYTAYVLARNSKAADGAIEAMLLYGKPFMREQAIDIDTTDGGVAHMLTELGEGEYQRFFAWVAGQRAERLASVGLENLFRPEDIARFKRLDQADATHPDRPARFARALERLNAFNEAVLKIGVDSGYIDPQAYEIMREQIYVPFYRMLEDEGVARFPTVGRALVNQQALKRLKGGTSALNADLLENALRNWSNIMTASLRNQAAREVMTAAIPLGIVEQVPSGTKNSVRFWDGGQQVHVLVHEPHLLAALQSLTPASRPWMRPMRTMKHWLTFGVTANPAFKIRNLIRDSLQSVGTTGELPLNPLANVARGIREGRTGSATYSQMLAGGGVLRFGTAFEGDRASAAIRETLATEKRLKGLMGMARHLWDAYQRVGDLSENVNRVALFKELEGKINPQTGKPYTLAERNFMARDLMDFTLQGGWEPVRFLAETVPFFNARMQGLYRLGRGVANDPRRAYLVAGGVAAASVALAILYQDDEDWKRREDWDRDTYWWFKIGDMAFRIPKPFELGAFGTIAERSYELVFSDEMSLSRYGSRISDIMTQQLSMSVVPQFVSPFFEIDANRSSFTGRPIESMSLQNLRPEDRYSERTSTVARVLGSLGLPQPAELLRGRYAPLSPVQIEHLVYGYTGWLGSTIMAGVDWGLRPLITDSARPAMRLKDVFLAGNFVETLPTGSSRYLTAFYDTASEVEQAYASYRNAIKLGRPDRAAEIMATEGERLRQYRLTQSVKRSLSALSAQAKRVEASTTMSPVEKRRALDAIEQRRHELTRNVAL